MIDRLMETPLPARPGGWRRWSGAPLFSHYNRLVALVLVANGWFALACLQLPFVDVQVVSQLVMFNLALAILVRQQYVINGLFWLATRIPVTWPLCIRRHAAKVYHLGGCTAVARWRRRCGSRCWSAARDGVTCNSPTAFRRRGCWSVGHCWGCWC